MNHDLNLKEFGERLQKALKSRYLNRSALATRAGLHKSQVTLYCQGKVPPSPQNILTMAMHLDCSPDWLSYGEGSIEDKYDFEKYSSSKSISKVRLEREGDNTAITFIFSKQEFNQFLKDAINYSIL